MARTPLLRALKLLAREHAAAERLGTTPAELRQRAAAASRRDVLKAAACRRRAGAGVTLPARAAAAPPPHHDRDRGCRHRRPHGRADPAGQGPRAATLYEASPRVGGRMHSDESAIGTTEQVSEFCGELIDSGHTTILGLAARFGLPVDDLLGRPAVRARPIPTVPRRPLSRRAGRHRLRARARRGEEGSHRRRLSDPVEQV